MTFSLEALAFALDPNAKRRGNGFTIRCPSPTHEDNNASCSLDEGDSGSPVFCCHSRQCPDAFDGARQMAGHLFPQRLNGHSRPVSLPAPVTPNPPTPAPQGASTPNFARFCPDGHQFTRHWQFTNADGEVVAYTARYDAEGGGGKQFRPFMWDGDRWVPKAIAERRPLWNLGVVLQRGSATVIVCEGEGKAEVLADKLGHAVVCAWSGGAQAWQKADWEPLRGRRVLLWPDNDEVGRTATIGIAAALRNMGCTVKFIKVPDGKPEGWDAGDLVREGEADVTAWIRDHMVEELVQVPAAAAGMDQLQVTAYDLGLTTTGPKEIVDSNERNVTILVMKMIELGILDVFTDAFNERQYIKFGGGGYRMVDWETDVTEIVILIQRLDDSFKKISAYTCERTLRNVCSTRRRDLMLEWFEALPAWDGVKRFPALVDEGLGVIGDRDFAETVLRNHLLACCVRQYVAGAKYDHVVVLEGLQGIGKSTLIEALAPNNSCREISHAQFGTRDFYDLLHGSAFVEISELTSIQRSQLNAVKSDITKNEDTYRSAFGRSVRTLKRRCVFWGSTNESEYLHDTTGSRRFWPVQCGTVSIDWVRRNRDQLWAEVKAAREAGEEYWLVDGEMAQRVQDERRVSDPWEDEILVWLREPRMGELSPKGVQGVSTFEVLRDCLRVPSERRDRGSQMRVGSVLRTLGGQRRKVRHGQALAWEYFFDLG